MRTQDWGIRHRLERLSALYAGRRLELQPHSVDTGLDTTAAVVVGAVVSKTVMPGSDYPFLWIGNSSPRLREAGATDFRAPQESLVRVTLLRPSWQLADGRTAGGLQGFVPMQVFCGYQGKPSLFAYPYLFQPFDQVRFDYVSDSAGNFDSHVLIGYKVVPGN